VDNDYAALIISGEPAKEELTTAWINILSQYYEVREDDHAVHYISLACRINEISLRLKRINAIVERLMLRYSARYCDMLREEGHSFEFTEETYKNDLVMVVNAEKMYVVELNELQQEYIELQGKRGDKPTEQGFYDTLSSIERMQHVRYDEEHITVFKYATLCKKLEQHIEQRTPQQDAE
jgi:hypothetical protein